jgi:hypothetical protein
MIPKPSVALWTAKPTIKTVARPISPVLAETPIARPSAKLWRPIAAAIVIPVRSAFALALRSSRVSIEACSTVIASVDPPAIGGIGRFGAIRVSISARPALPAAKPTASRAARPVEAARLPPWCSSCTDFLDDLDAVHEDLREEEGEDADREHRQRHAGALGDDLEAAEGQAEVDREARQGPSRTVSPKLIEAARYHS